MTFDVDMENALMASILNDGSDGADAAEAWLKDNPGRIDTWTAGVTTLDGQDGAEAAKAAILN